MFVEMCSSPGLLSGGDMIIRRIRRAGHMPVRWSDFTSPDVWVRTEAPPVSADEGDTGMGGPLSGAWWPYDSLHLLDPPP